MVNFSFDLKFKKNNRGSFFKINNGLGFRSNNILHSDYGFGLFSLSNFFITKSQVEMIFFLIKKIIKEKRKISRLKVDSTVLLKEGVFVGKDLNLFSLKLLERKYFFIKQIQKILKTSRKFKKLRSFYLKFNFISSTLKSIGIRMGKGKGEPKKWHSPISFGQCIVQLRKDVKPFKAFLALKQLKYRLPFKTYIYFSNPRVLYGLYNRKF